MSFANRYSAIGMIHAQTTIPEPDVLRRTLTAVRTLKALPDRERRFLTSGTKSGWVPHLVEWSDLVAQAELVDDDIAPPERVRPSRPEIADAMIAGEWFAKLALIPENIDEFEARVDLYRQKKRKSAQVADQEFLTWLSLGWTLKSIGERLRINENQAERRGNEISRNLFRIANGTARICNPEDRQREREAHCAFGGAGA